MDEFMKGTAYGYADEVAKGVKPVAEVTVKTGKAMECVSLVYKHHPEVTCYVEECANAPGWSFVWMMKDARMLDVIIQRPLEPKTAADHWYLGKLFGYSDTEILDWVDENERAGGSSNNRLKIEPVCDGISTAVTQYKVTDDLGSIWMQGARDECELYLYGR